MSSLNNNSARVIDPVLSGIAQGYRHAERVGHVLFPPIPVLQRGGKVIEFGYESFYDYKAVRAPGASVKRIQFGYEGKPYVLTQYTLDAVAPREHIEEAKAVPGIDLGKRAVNTVMDSLSLSLEVEQAKIATDPANYGDNNKLALIGAARWRDPDSDPINDIEEAKDQVRTTCGVEPNRMVAAKSAFRALKNHPKIVERFKFTTAESVTAKMLAGLFDLEEFAIGRATYKDDTTDATTFKEAWSDDAVLAYVPSQNAGMEQPSYGYTYTLSGHPFVEEPRWNGDVRSWLYGVTYERQPVLTGIASGFLFKSAGGAI